MPASKKILRNQENKKKEAAGTKVAVNAGGIPKKAEKPKVKCEICRAELIASMPTVLNEHAANRHPKFKYSDCYPTLAVSEPQPMAGA